MATNTRKRVHNSDSEANPKPSSMVPKKGKMNKKLSKREREEIARSLKQINLVVLSDEVTSQLKLVWYCLWILLEAKIVQVYPCQSLLMWLNNCDVSMTKSMQSNTCKS